VVYKHFIPTGFNAYGTLLEKQDSQDLLHGDLTEAQRKLKGDAVHLVIALVFH
jgi:hypothetical protein